MHSLTPRWENICDLSLLCCFVKHFTKIKVVGSADTGLENHSDDYCKAGFHLFGLLYKNKKQIWNKSLKLMQRRQSSGFEVRHLMWAKKLSQLCRTGSHHIKLYLCVLFLIE